MFKWSLVLALFLALSSKAQQSFYNVPSSELTPKHKIFVQEQLNLNSVLGSNTTFDMGINDRVELGCNVYSIDYRFGSKRFETNADIKHGAYLPLVTGNFQVKLNRNENSYFTIGSELSLQGVKQTKAPPLYGFLNYKWRALEGKWTGVAGVFYADDEFTGNRDGAGIQLGTEYFILKRISVMADGLIANTDISNGVVGLVFYPNKHFPISVGYEFPLLGANQRCFVMEFTFVP